MTQKNNIIREKILKGLTLTYHQLIKSKKERNLDLVISDQGKVVRLHAKDYYYFHRSLHGTKSSNATQESQRTGQKPTPIGEPTAHLTNKQ